MADFAIRVAPKLISMANKAAPYKSNVAVYNIRSKTVEVMPTSAQGRLTRHHDNAISSDRPIWGSSGRTRRTSQQRSALILPQHTDNKSAAGVRRSRSVTPVRQHYQYGSNSWGTAVPSTKQQIQRFSQQHQKLHKTLAKTAAEKHGNHAASSSRQSKLNNMGLSLRASGSDTMLQKHFVRSVGHATAAKQLGRNQNFSTHAPTASRPRTTGQKSFPSAVIGQRNTLPADHFRDRSSSEADDIGLYATAHRSTFRANVEEKSSLLNNKPPDSLLERPRPSNVDYARGSVDQTRENQLPNMHRFSGDILGRHEGRSGGGDFDTSAETNTFHLHFRANPTPKKAEAVDQAQRRPVVVDSEAPYCTCSDAEENTPRSQQHFSQDSNKIELVPSDHQNRVVVAGQRPTVNFSTAPPTHYVYTPNQTLNSTMNGSILENQAQSSPSERDAAGFGSPRHADRFTPPNTAANVYAEQQKLPPSFDDRYMKRAEFDANQRLHDAASTREEVVMLRTQLYDLLNKLAGLNALSGDFASTLRLASAGGPGQPMPNSPTMPRMNNSVLPNGGDSSFMNGAATSTASYMSVERELQRLRCLIDIKDQQLERQQHTLDRRQLVSSQTNEQHEQMEKRLQQLERHFDQQQQTLQQTYQTHLLELERSNGELHRQLQAATTTATVAPNHDAKNLSRETERLRYEYSQLRLEYDAEVRTARDEQQKLRLQLNDMRHQVEQHATRSEEREKEWRRERKQLETDRDALVEKLNQRVKQLSQLWNDHRHLEEQYKDAATLNETLQRDKLRLEEEAKLLVEDARHFQREAADSAQLTAKERTSSKQALQDAVNSERQRNAERYEKQIRMLEETVREQKRFIEQLQRVPVASAENNNNPLADAAATALLKQQKANREKLRKALLVSRSVSEADSDDEKPDERRSPKLDRTRRRRRRREEKQQERSRSTNDIPIRSDDAEKHNNNAAAWQQQIQHQQAQTEYFRQQYEQLRITFEQRLAVHDSVRVALDEKTQETYGLLSELNRLKRHARDADETHAATQRRIDDDMRHLRKTLDDLRTKYAAKADLCEQLKANLAQLHQRLGAAEHETVLKLDEQKREFEQRYADMQKQLRDLADELLQARTALDEQKQLVVQKQEMLQKKRASEDENEATAKQHRFSLRLAEQLQQMEARLAQAENKAGEWQQKLMNVQAAYEQVFGS